VNKNYCEGFQGQRSKVEVMTRWNALFRHRLTAVRPLSEWRRHADRRCGVEARLSFNNSVNMTSGRCYHQSGLCGASELFTLVGLPYDQSATPEVKVGTVRT